MTGNEIKLMIVEEFKTQGLAIGEDAAIAIVKVVFGLIPKVVLATDNKIDDILAAIVPIIEPKIMEMLDEIDGQIGN